MSMTVSLPEAAKIMFLLWSGAQAAGTRATTIFLLGPPGVGKTSIARDIAAQMEAYDKRQLEANTSPEQQEILENRVQMGAAMVLLDLTSQQPEDLMGLPSVKGEVTQFVPHTWHAEVGMRDRSGVLILDDLPAAASSVQTAARQIALEGQVHDHKLSKRVLTVVTGNRRDDKTGATSLPSHFINSVIVMTIVPDRVTWNSWYAKSGGDPLIPAFLEFKNEHFSKLPKTGDENGVFATPRTWAKLGQALAQVGTDHLSVLASGLVGTGIAVELTAFHNTRAQLIAPALLLERPLELRPDPRKKLDSPDKIIATLYGIACETVLRVKARKRQREAVWNFLVALAWISGSSGEFVSLGVNIIRTYGVDTPVMNLMREVTVEITSSETGLTGRYKHAEMLAERLRTVLTYLQ